jgi:hypothetical protein
MDRKQLIHEINKELVTFRTESEKRGYPLKELRLVDYPGWTNLFNIEIYADWFDTMSMGEALDILTEIKFQTIRQEHRAKIFIIKILDKEDVAQEEEENALAVA